MKIGQEVEGRNQGVRTLFCNYSELAKAMAYIVRDDAETGPLDFIAQLYVQDTELAHVGREVELNAFAVKQGIAITFEVPYVPEPVKRFDSIEYMISVNVDPTHLGLFSPNLRPGDQFKLTHNLYVACVDADAFTLTYPEAFEDCAEVDSLIS